METEIQANENVANTFGNTTGNHIDTDNVISNDKLRSNNMNINIDFEEVIF